MVGNKSLWEIHVTLVGGLVWPCPEGWTASAIGGDPDLGPGLRHYRTTHRGTWAAAKAAVADARAIWPMALRYKVDLVVLDERAKYGE